MADDKGKTASKPAEKTDGSRDRAREDRNRKTAQQFRDMGQSERLNNKTMNAPAKVVAAATAMIENRYGKSQDADRMKRVAQAMAAKSIEKGHDLRAPRMREAERNREAQAQSRSAPDKDR